MTLCAAFKVRLIHLPSRFIFSRSIRKMSDNSASAAGNSGFRVAVLGAGVNALSSAVRLQQIRPGVKVDLIAELFHMNTTSCVAAGVYRMEVRSETGNSVDRVRRWCQLSVDHFFELAHSAKAHEAGVSMVPIIHLLSSLEKRRDGPLEQPIYLEHTMGGRELTESELKFFGNGAYVTGYSANSALCECEYYLPYLTNIFQQNGGSIIERKLTTLDDFLAENAKNTTQRYAAVVNCLGLGAREFVPDPKVYPVRGQVDRVVASWLKYSVYADEDIYIYPGRNYVVVGGVRQRGNESLAPSEEDAKHIRERAEALMPSLHGAKLVRTDVGLRPAREGGVRLEAERRGEVTVVHNYGHGGHGVSLSWGCAVDAAQLVSEALPEHRE